MKTQQVVNSSEDALRSSQKGKTLYDLADEYAEYLEGLNYSEETIYAIRYEAGRFMNWLERTFQAKTASELRKSHLFAWQKYLTERRTAKGLPLKPKTINKTVASIRSFLKHLAKKGYILSSLLDAIVYVKEPKFLPLGVLSHAKVRKMLRKIDTSSPEENRNRTVLEILYSTGIRAGELVKLNVNDFDEKNGTLRVFGKGKKERIVPLGKTALRYLETYIKAVRPFMLKKGSASALFINYRGVRYKYMSVLHLVHRAAAAVGIDEKVSPHTFRRSCTTELIRGGANLYHVKELLGHESLDTLKHYTKLTINDLRKTQEKCHPRERDD